MSGVLETELATLERHNKRLEKEHAGKFVLIHGEGMLGTFDTFQSAAKEGLRRFGKKPFLIRQIKAPPLTLSPSLLAGTEYGDTAGTASGRR